MKLNKEDLNKYRKIINEALKDVEKPHSIKLPNEVLDELFFGEVEKNRVKRFEYSFSAIENLDLSDYSFENVSFNSDIPVNLSNINAKIDFHKSYTYKIGRNFSLRNIDFSKTDLSDSNISGVKIIDNCDLSDTNIIWPTDLFSASNTDFTNTDMSSIFVPLTSLTRYNYADSQSFTDCIFTNTNLHFDTKNTNRIMSIYGNFGEKVLEERRKITNKMVKDGSIVGCYINGVKIYDKEKYKEIALEAKRKYEAFKSEKIDKTLRLIKQDVSSGGKSNN